MDKHHVNVPRDDRYQIYQIQRRFHKISNSFIEGVTSAESQDVLGCEDDRGDYFDNFSSEIPDELEGLTGFEDEACDCHDYQDQNQKAGASSNSMAFRLFEKQVQVLQRSLPLAVLTQELMELVVSQYQLL